MPYSLDPETLDRRRPSERDRPGEDPVDDRDPTADLPGLDRRPLAARAPRAGTWLDDRFWLEGRIATGGFGAIYRARTADGAPVALKILHPRLTGDPSMVARFEREGAILTQLHDPHTVETLAVGETRDGLLYIAMELLTGESLHARLARQGALPWQAAVAIARAVCSSLGEAHALGVVHRDLKPANIHLETRAGAEHVKLIDFGIVKIARGSAIDDGRELTRAGHMIGTYEYMSPEQIVGADCQPASDLYSLGVVCYEMLTGRRPFADIASSAAPAAMMTALLTQTPAPPALFAAIPPALDGIVMRCLERDPDARFASMAELAAALDRLGQPPSRRAQVTAPHRAGRAVPRDSDRQSGARRIADGTRPVVRTADAAPRPAARPGRGPASLSSTLPGMGVVTDRPGRPQPTSPARPAAPGTLAPPQLPPRVAAAPQPTSPGPALAVRSRRTAIVLCAALALAGIAAALIAALR